MFISEVVDPSDTPQDQNNTTGFVNTAPAVVTTPFDIQPMDLSLLTNAESGPQQSLLDFLAKPYRIAQGSLASTDTSSTFIPIQLYSGLTSLEPYASKLKGYFGIRADVRIRMLVNANKFQAGRYLLSWQPSGGTGTAKDFVITNGRWANLTTITQGPRSEIDINSETEIVMDIPYVSVLSHCPINATYADGGVFGYIKLFPYVPLIAVAGSTTASYDIFVSLHNVSLAAPCVPQMGKFKPTSEIEQKKAGVGPVEDVARSVGKLSNVIGERIPSLTWLTAPASWVFTTLESTAKAFGWSNPLNLEPVQRIHNSPYSYMNNPDAVDNCQQLALKADNSIEILPGFAGNDVDEMAIDYIKSKPAYIATFDWNTSQPDDTELWNLPVTLASLGTNFVDGTPPTTVTCYAPVAYLSKMFRFYRGGIRLIFKIVKTDFHSGRIAFHYNPALPAGSAPAWTTANKTYILREIIDIREGNTVDMIIPYISLTPYRRTDEVVGHIQVSVANALVAPATVSSSITVVVEAAGAPDLEFATPWDFQMVPCTVVTPQMGTFVPKQDVHTIYSGIIGNAIMTDDKLMSARACIGEKIDSISCLLKKADVCYTNTPGVGEKYLNFSPASIITSMPVGTAHIPYQADFFSHFCTAFLFNRGSTRIRVVQEQILDRSITECSLFTALGAYYYPTCSTLGIYEQTGHHLRVLQPVMMGDGMQVHIPQYTNTHSRVCYDMMCVPTHPITGEYTRDINRLSIMFQTDERILRVHRSVGDDFQLGHFVGFLPTITP